MRNARLDEAQAGIKIAGRNINSWTQLSLWTEWTVGFLVFRQDSVNGYDCVLTQFVVWP